MSDILFGKEFLEELEAEIPATRKCLERMKPELAGWKPHEKSMAMGYLSLLVAEIPAWVTAIIEKGEIDFATFTHEKPAATKDLVKHFEDNVAGARKALSNLTNEGLQGDFVLKHNDQILMKTPKKETISSTLNHWVHHRGQLTVYMRLNNIPVPSIYGPSADDKSF